MYTSMNSLWMWTFWNTTVMETSDLKRCWDDFQGKGLAYEITGGKIEDNWWVRPPQLQRLFTCLYPEQVQRFLSLLSTVVLRKNNKWPTFRDQKINKYCFIHRFVEVHLPNHTGLLLNRQKSIWPDPIAKITTKATQTRYNYYLCGGFSDTLKSWLLYS